MKKLKRQLAGVLIFTMLLSIVTPGMLQVQAAGELQTEVKYDDELIVVKNFAEYETVEYTQYKGKDEPVVSAEGLNVTIKDREWELAENDEIDLSWVSRKKEATIIIRGTAGDDVMYQIVKLPEQKTGLEVGFAVEPSSAVVRVSNYKSVPIEEKYLVGGPDTGYLYFYVIDSEKNVIPQELTWIQWKKGDNGNYRDLDEVGFAKSLNSFKAKGVKLSFKIKETAPSQTTDGTWASEEADYSYKKQGNAPKIPVDVSKHTLTFKSGQEYRVKVEGADYGKWLSVDELYRQKIDGKYKVPPVKIEELAVGESNGVNTLLTEDQIYQNKTKVQVRTAVNSNKGLIPSKLTTIPVVTMGMDAIEIGTAEASPVRVGYTYPYDAEKGVTITNTTEAEYEWTCASSADKIVKWNRLSAAKTTNDKTKFGTARISANTEKKTYYDPVNDKIFIRLAGDKTAGKLAGKPTEFSLSGLQVVEQSCTGIEMEQAKGVTFTVDTAADGKLAGATIVLNESKELEVDLKFMFDEAITRDQTARITKEFANTQVGLSSLKVTKAEGEKVYSGTSALKVKTGASGSYVINITLESVKLKITVTVPEPAPEPVPEPDPNPSESEQKPGT